MIEPCRNCNPKSDGMCSPPSALQPVSALEDARGLRWTMLIVIRAQRGVMGCTPTSVFILLQRTISAIVMRGERQGVEEVPGRCRACDHGDRKHAMRRPPRPLTPFPPGDGDINVGVASPSRRGTIAWLMYAVCLELSGIFDRPTGSDSTRAVGACAKLAESIVPADTL